MNEEQSAPLEDDASEGGSSLTGRLEAQRAKIFMAMSIIDACRLGSDSMLTPLSGEDDPDFADALAAAHGLLDDVVDELETAGKLFAPGAAR